MKAVEGRGSRGEGESERRGADSALHVRLGGVRALRGERQKRRKKSKFAILLFLLHFFGFALLILRKRKKEGW